MVVAVILIPRELSENTLTVCCCFAAFGRLKMPIVSVVLLVALIVKLCACVWHTFKENVALLVEVKDIGRNRLE